MSRCLLYADLFQGIKNGRNQCAIHLLLYYTSLIKSPSDVSYSCTCLFGLKTLVELPLNARDLRENDRKRASNIKFFSRRRKMYTSVSLSEL